MIVKGREQEMLARINITPWRNANGEEPRVHEDHTHQTPAGCGLVAFQTTNPWGQPHS